MSNLTDALIAAKLIGAQGGGSGGGSGLPEITTGAEEILALQTLTFEDQSGTYVATVAGTFDIATGDAFTVSYDGDDYEVRVFEIPSSGTLGFGNPSLAGMPADTGEPFFAAYIEGTGLQIGASTSDPTHEVGISSKVYTPANGSILIVDGGEWKAVPSEGIGLPKITENVVVLDSVSDYKPAQGAPSGIWLAQVPLLSTQVGVGDAIIVEWDGTSYSEILYAFSEGILALGNASIVGRGEDTGEPIFGMIVPEAGMGQCATNVSAGEHSIKVVKADDVQLYPDYGVPIIEGGEWVVKSNVITLDHETSSLLTNTSAIQGSTIGTLTANLDLSEYGVALPNDVYLPVVAVKFSNSNMETSFTLGISYYHNGTLTVRLKECTNTTYQAYSVTLTAVTLLIPQRYTYSGK